MPGDNAMCPGSSCRRLGDRPRAPAAPLAPAAKQRQEQQVQRAEAELERMERRKKELERQLGRPPPAGLFL